ncbi:MAG: hypothetical protein LBH43_17325 [Treponema sp.]|jgi:hypothetical protein|nr:hypothetical protein [Treponema sp.]
MSAQAISMADWASFSFMPYINSFIEELYENGSIDRWKREKAEREAGRKRKYDRAAIMRSAWAYRKGEGLTMSAALQRAWADAKRATLHIAV